MVAFVTGMGLGLERSSGWVLGSRGQLGDATFNRFGENVYVNAANGNLVITRTDEILTGRDPEDILSRTYNSLGNFADDNGDNWRFSGARRITGVTGTLNAAGSTVKRIDWDGSDELYTWDTTRSAYVCMDGAGAYDTLTYSTSSNRWTWTDGSTQNFDSYKLATNPDDGNDAYFARLWRSVNPNGDRRTYTYTGNLLTHIETQSDYGPASDKECIDFTYSGNNVTDIVTTLKDGAITRVHYTYDGSNRLWTVTTDLSPGDGSTTDGAKVTTTYTYVGTTDLVASVAQTGLGNLAFEYDGSSRVTKLTLTVSNGVTRVTNISYDTATTTSIEDPDGKVTTLTFDSKGQLKQVDLPPAQAGGTIETWKYTYNSNGDVLTAVDAGGKTINYEYLDGNGNLTLIHDAIGNTIRRKYDLTTNALMIETRYRFPDPDTYVQSGVASGPETTRYAYDTANHLRFIVSAEGYVTQFVYNNKGDRTSSIVYRDQVFDISGYAVDEEIIEGDVVTWLGTIADKSTVLRTDMAYDFRGNLKTVTTFSATDAAGVGLTTQPYSTVNYIYDQCGQLLQRQTTGMSGTVAFNIETFLYDGLWRLTHSVDMNGEETNVEFLDGNRTASITLGSGLNKFCTYDRAGELLTCLVSGTGLVSGTTTNKYDNLGHLRMVTDSTLRTTYYVYDAEGRKIAVIGSDASVTEYAYDKRNRLIKTITYANKLTTAQMALLVDGSSNPIHVEMSAIRPVTSAANDRWEWRVYDDANRLIEVVDGNGGATVFAYDGMSNLLSTTQYVNLLLSSDITTWKANNTTLTLVHTPQLHANDNLTRNFYDGDGRLVGTLNALGAFSTIAYDGAGQKTHTVAYFNFITSTTLRATGTFDQLVAAVTADSAKDVHSRYVYDGRGLLRYTLDAKMQPTEYAYDAAGNLLHTIEYGGYLTPPANYSFGAVTTQIASQNLATAADTAKSWEVFDSASRLAYSIDATGAVTQYIYNYAPGDNNTNLVVEQIRFVTRRTTTSDPTLATMNTWASGQANDGDNEISFVAYDVAGRAKYNVDAEGFASEFSYDTEGRLFHAYQYGAAVTGATTYTVADIQSRITALNLANNADNRKNWSVYDTIGRLAYSIDAMGFVTAYTYNTSGQVIKQLRYSTPRPTTTDPTLATMNTWIGTNADSDDHLNRMIYDDVGRLAFSVDAEAYVTKYQYDASGRLTGETRYANAYATIDDYDSYVDVGTMVSATGAITRSHSYDMMGRLADSYDGENVRTNYTYDALDRVVDKKVAYLISDEAVTHYTYNAASQVITETRANATADASTTRFAYDALGRVTDRTDADGTAAATKTHYAYDGDGRVTTMTRAYETADAAATSYTYDAFGNVATTTDPLNNVTYSYYDRLDRLELQADAEKYLTKFTYTIGGALKTTIRYATQLTATIVAGTLPTILYDSGEDATTTFTRDKLDRVTAVKDAADKTESYTLDAFGNRTQVTNRLTGVTDNEYDRLGRLKKETIHVTWTALNGTAQTDTIVNTFGYDSRGNRKTMTEALGRAEVRTTTYEYDKMDRLTKTTHDAVQVVNPTDLATLTLVSPFETIAYDKRGNIVQTVDAGGAETFFYYDDLDRKTWSVNAVGTLSEWDYAADGSVTVRVYGDAVALPDLGDPCPAPVNASNCRATTYGYDRLNRQTTTTVAGLLTGEYGGSAYATATGPVTVTNVYDKSGNVIRQTDGRGYTVYFYYDKLGRKTGQIDQNNFLTKYELDADGNVEKETRFWNAYVGTPPAALPSVTANGNDRVTTFEYDKNGRRTSESRTGVVAYTVNSSGALVAASTTSRISYLYNGLGEVTSKTEATDTATYHDYTIYDYDSMGRQVDVKSAPYTDSAGATVQQITEEFYDGLNNLIRTVDQDADPTHATSGDRTTTYTYDYQAITGAHGGRLASVTDALNNTRYYAYDKNGRVLKESYTRHKTDGSALTEANATRYDLLGRAVYQSVATLGGSTWTFGDSSQVQYNTYGEISARGVSGMWQETFQYDNGGHMWKSTAGDGTTKLFIYDKNGNQTAAIASSGATMPTTMTAAFTQLGSNLATVVTGIVVTMTVFDKRGQNTQTREPARQLTATGTALITHGRTYNAFGEVSSETDGDGNTTDFTYNTMGKIVQQQSPLVDWTDEAGTLHHNTDRPTQKNYYDLSGRLVGVQDANAVHDSAGSVSYHTNTRTLLSGTGHGDDEESALKEFHADGGVYERKYDVFGDLRTEINEILPVGKTETFTYDKLGHLLTQTHELRGDGTPALVDTYGYDELGRRTSHYNSQLTATYKDLTDYDAQGRVTRMADMGGNTTTYTYSAFTSSIVTSGLGTFGGWTKTTVNAAGLDAIETTDYFGRLVDKVDFGDHNYNFTFDLAGRLASRTINGAGSTTYAYYNTGLIKTITTGTVVSSYEYDGQGNRTAEKYVNGSVVYEDATMSWDAMNRMLSFNDAGPNNLLNVTGGATTAPADVQWTYDLNGNIRYMHADYRKLDDNGNVIGTEYHQDYWYTYDSMNRFIVTKGTLFGGVISPGADGQTITYDTAGRRKTAVKSYSDSWDEDLSGGEPGVDPRWVTHDYSWTQTETYEYSSDGYLSSTSLAIVYSGEPPMDAQNANYTAATYTRDAMGRVTDYKEYVAGNANPVYRRQVVMTDGITTGYNTKSQVLRDVVTVVRTNGTTTIVTTYNYNAETYAGSQSYTGAYLGGAVTHQDTVQTGADGGKHTETRNTYTWWDSALSLRIDHDPDHDSGESLSYAWYSDYVYDASGTLTRVDIIDGRTTGGNPRTVSFISNANGQVMQRHLAEPAYTAGDPAQLHYRFNGIAIGDISNDGTSDVDYATSITEHTRTQGATTGPFMGGRTNAQNVLYADFDQSYDPINGLTYESTSSRYTVVEGETLQSIAYSIWGDSSFWYMIADANGLTGSETLTAGVDPNFWRNPLI